LRWKASPLIGPAASAQALRLLRKPVRVLFRRWGGCSWRAAAQGRRKSDPGTARARQQQI